MSIWFILFAISLAAAMGYLIYRGASKGDMRGYFDAQTLGLPDTLRPFQHRPEEQQPTHDETKELVLDKPPAGPKMPEGFGKS
jgi:hypothetical protein